MDAEHQPEVLRVEMNVGCNHNFNSVTYWNDLLLLFRVLNIQHWSKVDKHCNAYDIIIFHLPN